MPAKYQFGVRLSLEEGEKVKAALLALGETGQKALKGITDASAPASRGLQVLDGTTRELWGRAEGLASRLGPLGGALRALGPAGIAAGAGLALVTGALTLGLRDFAEAERQQLRLEAVLKATGQASGLTAQEIKGLADSIEAATFATSEQATEAASVLTTFRSVAGDTFKRALVLAQDLATVFGTGLAGSAAQLGKALEDPIQGITALRRVGVSFTQTQRDMITEMVRLGDTVGAQTLILDELERQVGGAGAGEASGLAGAFNNVTDELGNFLEELAETSGVAEGARQALDAIGLGILVLRGALESFGDAPPRIELTAELEYQLDRFNALAAEIDAAAAKGDQSKVERLSDLRDAIGREYGLTEEVLAQIARQREEQAAAEAARIQAVTERNREAADERVTAAEKELATLGTATEKIAQVQAELARTRDELNALRSPDGSNAASIEDAIRLEEEIARRRIAQLEKSNSASGKFADREAEKIQGVIDKLAFEAAQLGRTAAERAVYQNLKAAGIETADLLVDAEGRLLGVYSLEAEAIAAATRALLERQAAEVGDKRITALEEQLGLIEAESALLGESETERALQLALLQRQNELRREGIDLTSEQAQRELQLTEEIARAKAGLERQKSITDDLTGAFEQGLDRIGSAITDMAVKGEDAAISFGNIWLGVLSEILQYLLRLAVIDPLKSAVGGLFNDLVASVVGGLGSSGSGVTTTNIISPGAPLFQTSVGHGGGIAGELAERRWVEPAIFAAAERYHAGGLAADEVPAILRRGEEVLTGDDPRHRWNLMRRALRAGGETRIEVHVHNAPGTRTRVERSESNEGVRIDMLVELVDEQLAGRIAQDASPIGRTIERKYGLDRGRGSFLR